MTSTNLRRRRRKISSALVPVNEDSRQFRQEHDLLLPSGSFFSPTSSLVFSHRTCRSSTREDSREESSASKLAVKSPGSSLRIWISATRGRSARPLESHATKGEARRNLSLAQESGSGFDSDAVIPAYELHRAQIKDHSAPLLPAETIPRQRSVLSASPRVLAIR